MTETENEIEEDSGKARGNARRVRKARVVASVTRRLEFKHKLRSLLFLMPRKTYFLSLSFSLHREVFAYLRERARRVWLPYFSRSFTETELSSISESSNLIQAVIFISSCISIYEKLFQTK